MREIKLRAWDKKYKRFIYLNFCNPCGTVGSLVEPERHQDYENWEQFTGLKDKNGIEIYEKDIIVMYYRPNADGSIPKTCPFVINNLQEFFENKGYQEKELCEIYGKDVILEVVGNIYENPELLKIRNKTED